MRVLLPPSETKRDGGDPEARFDLDRLSFPGLRRPRTTALSSLRRLSSNLTTMSEALRLGPTQHHELMRNRMLRVSPTLAALERYTGVLYDGIDVDTLAPGARLFAGRSVVIHSALFGLIGADDPIPAYRVSHDSRLPDIRLRSLWREPLSRELGAVDELILDLRSEAYADLGPLPAGDDRFFVRVVTPGRDGTVRALNHFNKKGKGDFVRAILDAGHDHPDVTALLEWASSTGIRLRRGAPGELELIVDQRNRAPER